MDLFRNEVIDAGGIGILESLSKLDAATLAALIEWNRINLLRIEQKLVMRRLVYFLIAALSIVATLDKLEVFKNVFKTVSKNQILISALRVYGEALLSKWWLGVLMVGVPLVLELTLWRPGKLRIEEFGQILAVAFAYISKMPCPEKGKIESASGGDHGESKALKNVEE